MKREENTGKKRPKTLKGLWRVVTYEIMFRLRQKVVENEEHEEIFHWREKLALNRHNFRRKYWRSGGNWSSAKSKHQSLRPCNF